MAVPTQPKVEEMIRRIDAAVAEMDAGACCRTVKNVLEDIVASGEEFVPAEFLRTHPERYARRQLYRDPQGRYSVLIMVWDKGQGTALHDHAGMWCVECVYRGQIKVVSYDLEGMDGDRYQFTKQAEIFADVAEAGALIPPFEYHTLANAIDTPAVTIHVYGGDMTWCHAFVPDEDGLYRRERRELCFTD